jgi:hypothetical protein
MFVQILEELTLAGRSTGDAALPEIHMSALSVCRQQALREAGKPFWRR